MNPAIIKLTEEELGSVAILGYNPDSNSLLATIDNVKFTKTFSFSSDKKHEAIQCCQTLAQNNVKTLLVEGRSSVTVWMQNKADDTYAIPTRKVKRQYRGQTYEVEVADNSAIQKKVSNTQKVRKKYRGQYID